MAEPLFAYPNYLDTTFYNVVLGGGDWELPLSNLQDEAIKSAQAQSRTDANADTRFHVDLGGLRGSRFWGFPFHNMSLNSTYRIRASATPKFVNATVASNASAAATTFSLQAGSTNVVLAAGDILSFAGHDTIYQVTAGVTITATNTGTVAIKQDSVSPAVGLTDNIVSTEVIRCHTGDYTGALALYDSGSTPAEVFETIYEWGSIDSTHPSWFTGKATEEQRRNLPFPLFEVIPFIVAQYWYFEFFDSSNSDGYVRLPRLFLAPGYQSSRGIDYGAQHNFITDTRVDTTLGGRRVYGVEPVARTIPLSLSHLPVGEAMNNVFDMQREIGIHKQFFFVFDPDDTALKHRRSFLATMEKLAGLEYPYYNAQGTTMEIREVVA